MEEYSLLVLNIGLSFIYILGILAKVFRLFNRNVLPNYSSININTKGPNLIEVTEDIKHWQK